MREITYSERTFFSTRLANKKGVGVNAAIVHAKIAYFVQENKKAGRNFIDGYYWTYATQEELHEAIPFFTVKQIRLAIQKLKDNNLIITGNYNKWKTDRTIWYTIPDKVLKAGYPQEKNDDKR